MKKKKLRKLKRFSEFIRSKPTTDKPYTWVPVSDKNSPEPPINNRPISSTIN